MKTESTLKLFKTTAKHNFESALCNFLALKPFIFGNVKREPSRTPMSRQQVTEARTKFWNSY